ncbi:unnamed protein product [Durusdinium trenchii]|uniref:GB1/RHD3-type G domain-containing protein n=1 Tax=Durusdinium trenchii TaxID=1381693 RepID=A0ABP0JD80_9DINO
MEVSRASLASAPVYAPRPSTKVRHLKIRALAPAPQQPLQATFPRSASSRVAAALTVSMVTLCRRRVARRAVEAEVATLGEVAQASTTDEKPRPLQLVQIDLEKNKVRLNEEDLAVLEKSLENTGVEKVAIIAVMGAFRTGKSFLLDLMLRYLREKHPPKGYKNEDIPQECEVPDWVQERKVPDWAVNCGPNLLEGREGGSQDREGFVWRPGMEKCTEGIWVWSEVFVCKAGDEDVAVVLMDTQGAWDARMSKEQSATIFGLTTLLASRLIYNVSKQIQQDKIDNLLYFTDFAKAALRAMQRGTGSVSEPFQTLEFLVRDWPHYQEATDQVDSPHRVAGIGVENHCGGEPMFVHFTPGHSASVWGAVLESNASWETTENFRHPQLQLLYFNPKKSQDTKSVEALVDLFHDIDVWCLPHPSLKIESETWNGDLAVIEKQFWRYIDGYLDKIFDPAQLQAKQNLGNAITVSTFGTVLREFSSAFSDAAPQAQTFSEAMEASTGLLARDVAIKKAKKILAEKALSSPSAITDKEFDEVAAMATKLANEEFTNKAIFGTSEGIQRRKEMLLKELEEEIARARDDNERKLEASLTGLTNFSILGLAAFVLDRASDFTCDWWSGFCRDVSTDLSYVEVAVFGWVGFNLFQISQKQGSLNATAAALELGKTVVRTLDRGIKGAQKSSTKVVDVEVDTDKKK